MADLATIGCPDCGGPLGWVRREAGQLVIRYLEPAHFDDVGSAREHRVEQIWTVPERGYVVAACHDVKCQRRLLLSAELVRTVAGRASSRLRRNPAAPAGAYRYRLSATDVRRSEELRGRSWWSFGRVVHHLRPGS